MRKLYFFNNKGRLKHLNIRKKDEVVELDDGSFEVNREFHSILCWRTKKEAVGGKIYELACEKDEHYQEIQRIDREIECLRNTLLKKSKSRSRRKTGSSTKTTSGGTSARQ